MACDDKQVENADLDDPYAKKNCVQASVDHNIIPVEQHGQVSLLGSIDGLSASTI